MSRVGLNLEHVAGVEREDFRGVRVVLRAQGMNIQTSSVSLCFRRCGQSASPPRRPKGDRRRDGVLQSEKLDAKHETGSAIRR
ncbi:hypothetical protein ROHU_016971 [Labeo rohita]|uniref:Uncharacterized protein n=1 Tax=Labeo rohita TaxID=84645 RepID=A0A498NHY9_LABRO|nr:hypothetical protein ROHU_016971 [Labeo rohita]